MKIYHYKEIKYSLAYGQSFNKQGIHRAKNFMHHMLDREIPPNSIHLIFCPNGFICQGSKANGKRLVTKESSVGNKKYWVKKGQAIDNKLVAIIIFSLFLLLLMSQI